MRLQELKHNRAIPLGVSRITKAERPRTPAVPAEYGCMLLDEAARKNLDAKQLFALAGYTLKKTNDRQVHHLKTGRGAFLLAHRLRRVLVGLGAKVPPVIFDDDDLAQWAKDGATLARISPEVYELERARIRDLAHQLTKSERATTHPLNLSHGSGAGSNGNGHAGGTVSRNDRPGRYSPPNEPQAKDPVDPPRKPPPRTRR